MAEENGTTESPKKSPMMMIIIIVLGVLVVGGGAAYFFLLRPAPPQMPAGAGLPGEEAIPGVEAKVEEKVIHSLKTFIVNLAGGGGTRYLKITIELEAPNNVVEKELGTKESQVTDTILTLLTCKSYDDIKDIQGKTLLKEEIVSRVNTILRTGRIRRAYFTEFVIQ